MNQHNFFQESQKQRPPISITPEIEALIANNSPVAFSISGGKDSDTAVLEGLKHLDSIGHKGERILIQSHLGRIEHYSAIEQGRRLAEHTGLRHEIVYPANEMIDRWKLRWRNNIVRYVNLECVKLILPWSTPSMRFCTSEEKESPIASRLKKLFPGQTIINVTGIRREESANRAKSQIVKLNSRLHRKSDDTNGVTWNIILDYRLRDVKDVHEENGFSWNEIYDLGLSRFSCSFCIMAKQSDLVLSARIPSNQPAYRELVELEIESTFSFQSDQWLGDVAPDVLIGDQYEMLVTAKQKAIQREGLEVRIPKHLLYVKGWPAAIPRFTEAELLCEVRQAIAELIGIKVSYTDPFSILERYEELMSLKVKKKGQVDFISVDLN